MQLPPPPASPTGCTHPSLPQPRKASWLLSFYLKHRDSRVARNVIKINRHEHNQRRLVQWTQWIMAWTSHVASSRRCFISREIKISGRIGFQKVKTHRCCAANFPTLPVLGKMAANSWLHIGLSVCVIGQCQC